ncbi:MAG: prepilin peptidase [Nitrospirae bacterium]|nr:MAG: prepilin peptidase [Nitrospirota bacterium]
MGSTLFLYATVCLFGSLVGSFLNVCIHRLPRRESIVWPSSHCPTCNAPIAPYDNLPILSFLFLRGRCRVCRAPISPRYPVVEAVNAAGYGLILWWFGAGWPAAAYAVLFSSLLVITAIDLTHQIIPDVITLPGIPVGLVLAATILPISLLDSVLGLLVGGGLLWFIAWASPYLFGKEGMGGGDIKLLAMVGAFLGWKPTLLTIMVGAMTGSLVGISLLSFKLLRRDQYIPFGPFLAFGALIALFFHQDIFSWYETLMIGAR